jgi:hypothetical protein
MPTLSVIIMVKQLSSPQSGMLSAFFGPKQQQKKKGCSSSYAALGGSQDQRNVSHPWQWTMILTQERIGQVDRKSGRGSR